MCQYFIDSCCWLLCVQALIAHANFRNGAQLIYMSFNVSCVVLSVCYDTVKLPLGSHFGKVCIAFVEEKQSVMCLQEVV